MCGASYTVIDERFILYHEVFKLKKLSDHSISECFHEKCTIPLTCLFGIGYEYASTKSNSFKKNRDSKCQEWFPKAVQQS